MAERQRNITTWISIAIILFGMVSGAIAFTVTTNNKANVNEKDIDKIELKDINQDERIRTLDEQAVGVVYIKQSIDEMKANDKKISEQNTNILVAIGEIKIKLEME